MTADKTCAKGIVVFEKFMAQAELPSWYSAADCGFWGKASITIIEGMACRLPIIVPELDTVSHLISHNNARPFTDFRVNEIKKCFEYILKNQKTRERMGKNSEKAVLNEFNYRHRTEKLMKIYETCFNDN